MLSVSDIVCWCSFFYSVWLCFSSYGQNLDTSTFIGETSFAILIAILGLVLFSHLIGNMQVLADTLFYVFLFSFWNLYPNYNMNDFKFEIVIKVHGSIWLLNTSFIFLLILVSFVSFLELHCSKTTIKPCPTRWGWQIWTISQFVRHPCLGSHANLRCIVLIGFPWRDTMLERYLFF